MNRREFTKGLTVSALGGTLLSGCESLGVILEEHKYAQDRGLRRIGLVAAPYAVVALISRDTNMYSRAGENARYSEDFRKSIGTNNDNFHPLVQEGIKEMLLERGIDAREIPFDSEAGRLLPAYRKYGERGYLLVSCGIVFIRQSNERILLVLVGGARYLTPGGDLLYRIDSEREKCAPDTRIAPACSALLIKDIATIEHSVDEIVRFSTAGAQPLGRLLGDKFSREWFYGSPRDFPSLIRN